MTKKNNWFFFVIFALAVAFVLTIYQTAEAAPEDNFDPLGIEDFTYLELLEEARYHVEAKLSKYHVITGNNDKILGVSYPYRNILGAFPNATYQGFFEIMDGNIVYNEAEWSRYGGGFTPTGKRLTISSASLRGKMTFVSFDTLCVEGHRIEIYSGHTVEEHRDGFFYWTVNWVQIYVFTQIYGR